MPARLLDRTVLALLPVALVAFALHCIVAHDVWWQLATGRWVLENGIPSTDPFSYAFPDREWIEMRWLFCVAIHLVHGAFGLNGLILAKTAALAAAFALLWWLVPDRRWWAASFGVTCALALAHARFQVRPELVTYVLLVVSLACLTRYKAGGDRRWLWALPAVQILWTNAHTLFALGPIVAWVFVAAEWAAGYVPARTFRDEPARLSGERLRHAAVAAALTTAACLVNPYFLKGALFPLQLFGQIQSTHTLETLIDELRSPFAPGVGTTSYFAMYLAVAAVSAATFWVNRRRAALSTLALWGAFFYLSTLAQRNVSLFGIVAGFAVAQNLTQAPLERGRVEQAVPWVARAVCLAFLVVTIPAVASDAYYRRTETAKRFGLGVAEHRFPIRALAFVRREDLPRPVFNSLGDGGYVLFEGGPRSVFVDGRLEVYGGEVIRDAVETLATGRDFDALAARLGVSTVVLRHGPEVGLLAALEQRPDWAPVYFDETHAVYVRITPETRAAVDRLRIDWRNPVAPEVEVPPELAPRDWLAGWWPKVALARDRVALGQLFVTVGNLARAEEAFAEAVRRDPGEETASLYLGLLYRAGGREAEAAPLLARLGTDRLDRADVQMLAGAIFERAGNTAAASEAYQRAVALGERSPAAYLGIARTALAANRPDAARAALLEIARLTPSDPTAWNNLGMLALRTGAAADAMRNFETSLRLSPNQPPVLNQVGILKLQAGDAAGARDAFTRALASDPGYRPARENLDRLGG
jgi:Flp pilus assembly protein TadD